MRSKKNKLNDWQVMDFKKLLKIIFKLPSTYLASVLRLII